MNDPGSAVAASAAAARAVWGAAFDNSYARDLEGAYVAWTPQAWPRPTLVRLNGGLAEELGLSPAALATAEGVAMLAGNVVPPGAQPLAQTYAGHQFGGLSPQLGDGRALLLGEVIDRYGQRRDIALKGSGRTPFSRGGDGRAALGPVLREYLVGEAMHAMGIPTTRALAAVTTGDTVQRDRRLPGAVLTRVAASHIRVGTFQFFAIRHDAASLRRLADYTIARHYPQFAGDADRYLELLRAVSRRQARLVARWMGIGFIHGVMNTDNMTVSGETIDYGPCAFIEGYDPATVFSSIDTGGRYAYGNQPGIAQWNLARFAECLLPLIDDDADRAVERATTVVREFASLYESAWREVLRAKLGLGSADGDGPGDDGGAAPDDGALADELLVLLARDRVDFTLGFRDLSAALRGDDDRWLGRFASARTDAQAWLSRWQAQIGSAGRNPDAVASAMELVNPLYIPRNHQVEAALAAATDHDDLAPFERLLAVVADPYAERAADAAYAEPAPAEQTACYQTFCGT
ncbi:MAG TPA: YdiU family protein [Burkholderiaceae bacterium]|nr:YdiU family protein [Burkholderiaceae bacterium]